jgi:hypothetical protein
MSESSMVETLREWIGATNPGFVTKDDLRRVEERLDELTELVDALERAMGAPKERSRPDSFDRDDE